MSAYDYITGKKQAELTAKTRKKRMEEPWIPEGMEGMEEGMDTGSDGCTRGTSVSPYTLTENATYEYVDCGNGTLELCAGTCNNGIVCFTATYENATCPSMPEAIANTFYKCVERTMCSSPTGFCSNGTVTADDFFEGNCNQTTEEVFYLV